MKRTADISKGILDHRTGRIISWDEWSRSKGSKVKYRKGSYLPGWEPKCAYNRTVLNRRDRHQVKIQLRNASRVDTL